MEFGKHVACHQNLRNYVVEFGKHVACHQN